MRCRWHLSRGNLPDHFDITQAMWEVVVHTSVTVDELKAANDAIKKGMPKKSALKLIRNMKTRAMRRHPDAVRSALEGCSGDDDDDDVDDDDDGVEDASSDEPGRCTDLDRP